MVASIAFMPLWASIYILIMCVFSIYSHYDHFKRKECLFFALLDVLVDVMTILMFVAYWYESMIRSFSAITPYLFLFCLFWILCTAPYIYERELRSMSEIDKRKMATLGRYGYPIVYLLTISTLSIPLLVFAGKAAFRHQ